MKYDFITIGGATEDITFHVSDGLVIRNRKDILRQKLLAFEYGAKVKIENLLSTFGGGAANASVCFSRLGFKTAAAVAVGDDERGVFVLRNLKENGVDTVFCQKIKNKKTGLSLIVVGQGNEHIAFTDRGANDDFALKNYQLHYLKDTKWFYLSSLSGEWKKTLNNLFSVKSAKFAWNPGREQLKSGVGFLKKYFKKTEILILNKDEAIELAVSDKTHARKSARILNNPEELLKVIKDFGQKVTILTNGRFGAYVYADKEMFYQSVEKKARTVDTTGVGDAFGASFAAGFEFYHGDIKKSLKLAAKNSASAVGKRGAQNGLLKIKL